MGVTEEKKKALQLLKTARGQIDGIIKMIEDERYCIDISNQITAAQSILKKSNLAVLKGHLSYCVKDACTEGDVDDKLDEIMGIFERSLK